MSSQSEMPKSPQEKKRLDYENQRRGFSESAHALRHGKWRKKRRSAQRPERQGVAAVLAAARGTHSDSIDVRRTQSRTALPIARRLDLLLDALESRKAIYDRGLDPHHRSWQRLEAEVKWLRRFFADEPAWNRRRRAWVAVMLATTKEHQQ
jgi:hypothetical protein